MNDPVNHPEHYTSGKVECIDAMVEAFGVEAVKHFCLCNAFKYHWRHNMKNGQEDIEKATWYMDKYRELMNSEPTQPIDLQELEDRFGEYVRFVVNDMLTGEGKRWTR